MPRLDDIADPIASAGRRAGKTVPLWIQLPLAFLLTPLWAASWLQAMTNIAVFGVFVPLIVVGELTDSVRAGFAGAILWHAFIYSLIFFSVGWTEGVTYTSKEWVRLVPLSWIGLCALAFVGWLGWPLISILFS